MSAEEQARENRRRLGIPDTAEDDQILPLPQTIDSIIPDRRREGGARDARKPEAQRASRRDRLDR